MKEEKKALKEGIIPISNLAEWFGVTKSYFSRKKKEKLKELEEFCEYELIGKTKINIKKVKYEYYVKKPSSTYEKVKEETRKKWNIEGLDTSARVAFDIYLEQDPDKEKVLTEETIYLYTRKASNALFGERGSSKSGELGISYYEWGKWDYDKEKYVRLNQKELAVKKFLLQKYFGDISEEVIFIQDDIDKGLLTKGEAWDILTKDKKENGNFFGFLKEFYELTGTQLVKCTAVELTAF